MKLRSIDVPTLVFSVAAQPVNVSEIPLLKPLPLSVNVALCPTCTVGGDIVIELIAAPFETVIGLPEYGIEMPFVYVIVGEKEPKTVGLQ